MNSKVVPLLIASLAGIAVVSFFVFTNRPKEEMLPVNKIDPIITDDELGEYEELMFPDNTLDTSDWETYRNEEFGFEVRYPLGWVVIMQTKSQLQKEYPSYMYPASFLGHVVFDSLEPYFVIGVDIYNESVEQTIERGEKEVLLQGDSLLNGHMIQVNNSYGRWYPVDENEDYYDRGVYFLGDAQSGYRINHAINRKDTIDTQTYQQILLSFKLIK